MRVLLLLVGLSLVGCSDPAPEPSTPADAGVQAPAAPAPPLPAGPDSASGPDPVAPPDVPPAPAPPAAAASGAAGAAPPSPSPVSSVPTARPSAPPTPSRIEAADAFWASLRAAIRSGDRSALEAGLADVVTVGDVAYRRGSPQVQSVLEQIVENEQVRDAYLEADRLVHGPEESAFSSVARVETPEGDVTEARISGAIREVAPGDWRLVRLRTDPVQR